MDRFVDMQHVRLRNRKLDKYYLCADDDGEGVSISQRRNSLNTAWRVHIYDGSDGPQLLLHSAAYGRYLAATATPAPALQHGFRAKQCDYDQPVVPSIMWLAVRAGLGGGILLQNGGVRYLRANGKYLRWNTGVTVEDRDIEEVSAMMRWTVEPILLRERPPRIPGPIRTRQPEDLSVIVFRRQPGAWQGIRFVQATPDGLFPEAEQDWPEGRAGQTGQPAARRPRRYGRPTPLVVDLPRGVWGDILQIIVVISRTPALASAEQSIGDCGSDVMKLEVNDDCRTQPSQAGSVQSVHQEMLHNPSGSAVQSLTEHPDVSVEAARAKFLVAVNRSRSTAKELSQATDTLAYLQQQNVGALPKEERKGAIKEMRKVKEKVRKLGVAAALADEVTEQYEYTRALLRHGV